MRHQTLLELAERDGILLPDALVEDWPPQLSAADEKGWFRFQRLYDVARSVLRTEDDVRRLVREAAEDDVADGGRWLEIQVDPSGYAARFGGITAFTDLVLDAVREASEATGLGMAVVIAANRTRHPLDARTLARLAGQYAGRGVVGFGLSNDERRGTTVDFAPAFAIAERAGPDARPRTAASCSGPASVRTCLDALHADRLGHGVRVAEDPELLDRVVQAGVALEVCPVSNVALGVYSDLTSVPLPTLLEAGATVALGADDPLLFGSRLAGQYATMRAAHDLGDKQLAELARMSIVGLAGPRRRAGAGARRDRRLVGRIAGMSTTPETPTPDRRLATRARRRSSRHSRSGPGAAGSARRRRPATATRPPDRATARRRPYPTPYPGYRRARPPARDHRAWCSASSPWSAGCTCYLPLLLGPFAWVMGRSAVREIDADSAAPRRPRPGDGRLRARRGRDGADGARHPGRWSRSSCSRSVTSAIARGRARSGPSSRRSRAARSPPGPARCRARSRSARARRRCTSRASASRSAVRAPPRLVSARVCLVERAARPLP